MLQLYLKWILICMFIVLTMAEVSRDKLYLHIDEGNSLKNAFSFMATYHMSIDIQCDETNNASSNCVSSDHQICCNSTCYDSIDIIFTSGTTHILTENQTISNLQNIHFTVSQSGKLSTINCTKEIYFDANPGIAFIGLRNLTIEYLNIVGCGMKYVSTSIVKGGQFIVFLSALYVQNSTNLSVHNVNISNSNGTGLVIVDTNEMVSILSSVFRNNKASKSNAVLSGGGGIIIEFTKCASGILGCNSSNYQLANNSIVIVDNCVFEYNSALYNVSENVGANLDD